MKPIAILFLVLITSACSKGTITIKSGSIGGRIPSPTLGIGSKTGVKLSNGGGRVAGDDVSAKVLIQPNDRLATGPRLSGRFSISKTRVR